MKPLPSPLENTALEMETLYLMMEIRDVKIRRNTNASFRNTHYKSFMLWKFICKNFSMIDLF